MQPPCQAPDEACPDREVSLAVTLGPRCGTRNPSAMRGSDLGSRVDFGLAFGAPE